METHLVDTPFEFLSLFSGVAGLDLGFCLAFPRARVLGYVERDAYASAVLLARMEEKALELAPVFVGDIRDVRGSELGGRARWIVGGFPCQDISYAGKGAGIRGVRSGLWSEFARLIREIQPEGVFLENVGALLSRGLDVVLGDLASMGYDAQWGRFPASAVGAPHRRERVFVMAYRTGARGILGRLSTGSRGKGRSRAADVERGGEGMAEPKIGGLRVSGKSSGKRGLYLGCGSRVANAGERLVPEPGRGSKGRAGTRSASPEVLADSARQSVEEQQRDEPGEEPRGTPSEEIDSMPGGARAGEKRKMGDSSRSRFPSSLGWESEQPQGRGKMPRGGVEGLGDAEGLGSQGRSGSRGGSDKRLPFETGSAIFPPGPGNAGEWERILAESPELGPAVEPGFRVLADGMAVVLDESRADQLRCCGNGVVALQAAFAARILARQLGVESELL